jgi:type IV pilus assembly PilN-like protein
MRIKKDYSMFSRQQRIPTMHLSFQSPAVAVVRGVQWALFLIALASLGFAVSFLQESRSLDEQTDYYEHALARQHKVTQLLTEDMARAGLTLTEEQINAVRKEIAFANQLTEKRDFSWTEMLHNLEEGMPPHVSINSVRLNFQDSTIRLHGTVKTMQDLDALVTKLNETGTFSRVGLTEHNIQTNVGSARQSTETVAENQSNQRSTDVIDFTLTVTYHQNL